MDSSPSQTTPGGRSRSAIAIALIVTLVCTALGLAVSEAGAGQEEASDRAGAPPAAAGAHCPPALARLGICKEAHDHDAQADFKPFGGKKAKRPARDHGHNHPHGDGGAAHAHNSHEEDHSHAHSADEPASERERKRRSNSAQAAATNDPLGRSTLEQTIRGGDPAEGFQTLQTGQGERRVIREELAEAKPGRAQRRRSLLYAGQTTDWQLVDEESPSRVEFLDITANPPFPNALSAAWRPQEAFGPQAVEQGIRQLNAFADEAPVPHRGGRRARMEMVLMTGDQADNQQLNETEWVMRLLEGGPIDPNSGVDPSSCPAGITPSGQTADPERYAGVQDYDDYIEGLQFYDPDQPMGPKYSDWPNYPGLMDRAQRPFVAEGLAVPSYVTFGNHDALAQGNQKAIAPFEAVGVGCLKPLLPVADLTEAFAVLDPIYLAGVLATDPDSIMIVPPDPDRQYVDKVQYKEIFKSSSQPDGHGFDLVSEEELAASNGAASYYAWTPKPGLRLIGLDTLCDGGVTGPSSSGNIDDPQFRWLESELERASNRDQLIIVFGHHPIRSLTCDIPDETPPPCTIDDSHGHDINPGCDLDPRPSTPIRLGDDLTELFHRFPHVISYVAGHTHENAIAEFDRPEGGPGDFWGIETASLIDWPPQNRLLQLMDNCDGTLSIFGTTIDTAAPVEAPGSGTEADGMSEEEIASISRTLSYNDPQAGAGSGEGERRDRNVELLLDDPRRDPPRCARRGDGGGGNGGGGGGGGGSDRETQPPSGDGSRDLTSAGSPGAGTGSAGTGAGSLPFTGLGLGFLAVLALALLLAGRALRGRRGEPS